MGIISKSFTFSPGATILSSEHNTNFDTLYTLVNGNIDNNNIKTSAGIVYSKLTLTNSVVLADLASAIKSGADATLITGTAGTDTYVPKWDSNGDLVDGYALIDDDTMATASATNIPSAESVKEYVDTEVGNITNFDYAAGTNLVISNDGSAGVTESSYTKVKEIEVGRGGELTVKFTLDSTGINNSSRYVYAQIYLNETPVAGTEESLRSDSGPTEFSNNVSGLSRGDALQIYVKHGGDSGGNGSVSNFRLYEDLPLNGKVTLA